MRHVKQTHHSHRISNYSVVWFGQTVTLLAPETWTRNKDLVPLVITRGRPVSGTSRLQVGRGAVRGRTTSEPSRVKLPTRDPLPQRRRSTETGVSGSFVCGTVLGRVVGHAGRHPWLQSRNRQPKVPICTPLLALLIALSLALDPYKYVVHPPSLLPCVLSFTARVTSDTPTQKTKKVCFPTFLSKVVNQTPIFVQVRSRRRSVQASRQVEVRRHVRRVSPSRGWTATGPRPLPTAVVGSSLD